MFSKLFWLLSSISVLLSCQSRENNESDADLTGKLATINDCPTGLILKNIQDMDSGFLLENIHKSCPILSGFQSANKLETYLSQHPLTTMNRGSYHASKCMVALDEGSSPYSTSQYSSERSKMKKSTGAIEKAVVSDYYYYLNAFQQAAVGHLEVLTGLDLILQNKSLADIQSSPLNYTTAYLPKMAPWVTTLSSCQKDPSLLAKIVTSSRLALQDYHTLSWAMEGIKRIDSARAKQEVEQLTLAKELILETHPWLRGKELVSYTKTSWYALWLLGKAESRPNALNRTPAEASAIFDAALHKQFLNNNFVASLTTQLTENRRLILSDLKTVVAATKCLHASSTSCWKHVSQARELIGSFDLSSSFSNLITESDEGIIKTAAQDFPDVVDSLKSTKKNGLSAAAALNSAMCRKDARYFRDAAKAVRNDFGHAVIMTLATAGLGHFITLTKNALQAEQAMMAVYSAKEIELASRLNILNGIMIGDMTIGIANGAANVAAKCYKDIGNQLHRTMQASFKPDEPSCLNNHQTFGGSGAPLTHRALISNSISTYSGCLIAGMLNLVLSSLTIKLQLHSLKN